MTLTWQEQEVLQVQNYDVFPNEETKWAWLAGFIDGDGCFGFYKRPQNKKRSGYYYTAALHISSVHIEVLEFIRSLIGSGSICKNTDKRSKRTKWGFSCSSTALRLILPSITPYLIIKKEEAILMDEALHWMGNTEGRRGRSNEKASRLDEIVDLMKQLKRRGTRLL